MEILVVACDEQFSANLYEDAMHNLNKIKYRERIQERVNAKLQYMNIFD